MKRNQIIIIAIAAFIGLWMYSQSGNAGTTIEKGENHIQNSSVHFFYKQ